MARLICQAGKIGAIVMLSACASPRSPLPDSAAGAHSWTTAPARTSENGNVIYLGTGEDQSADLARFKAEAMALQDLANECSFVPKGARVLDDRYDEAVGIIHRSYARASVAETECEQARGAISPDEARASANAALQAEVERYEKEYDPPEPIESFPPGKRPADDKDTGPVSAPVLRQQIALTRQRAILDAGAARGSKRFEAAAQAVAQSAPEAFSLKRPNWTNHQAAALRNTVAERARIDAAYTPPPLADTPAHPAKAAKKGRGGRRHQTSQPAQTPATPDGG